MRQPVVGDERIMATLRVKQPRQVKTVLHSLSVYPEMRLVHPVAGAAALCFHIELDVYRCCLRIIDSALCYLTAHAAFTVQSTTPALTSHNGRESEREQQQHKARERQSGSVAAAAESFKIGMYAAPSVTLQSHFARVSKRLRSAQHAAHRSAQRSIL